MELLRSGSIDHAVSAEAALVCVRTTRTQGGMLPLLASAFLLLAEITLLVASPGAPLLLLCAIPSGAALYYLMSRGLKSAAEARAIEDAAQLAAPVSAALIDRVLLLGTTGAPPEQWCAVPVTEQQEQRIRTLALPGAYLRKS